jgi:hypothetical protein
MNTLWTFGDSFTYGHGCRPDGPIPEYYENYKSESDDVWPVLLGQMINMEVKNFGKCGASNDYILDSIFDNWDNFKEGDYVITGVTYHDRFDVPLKNNLISIFWDWDKYVDVSEKALYKKEEIETLINFQYFFCNDEFYKLRNLKRFNFLDKLLKQSKINSFIWDVNFYQYMGRFEKIATATNGKIEDYHFSFKGNKDFADMLYKKLITPELV